MMSQLETITAGALLCRVEKYLGVPRPGDQPYEVVESEGNVLTTLGADAIWQRVLDGGGTTNAWDGHLGESDATPWRGAYIAVGTSDTAATVADTDLGSAGSANAYYMTMADGFPKYADGTALNGSPADASSVLFQASFTTSVANFAWREWAIGAIGTNPNEDGGDGTAVNFTDTGGTFDNRMFNHKIHNFGTKTSAFTWVVNATFTIS
jgi:hypothetical protein